MLNTGMSEGFVMNDIEASKNLLDKSVVTRFLKKTNFSLSIKDKFP